MSTLRTHFTFRVAMLQPRPPKPPPPRPPKPPPPPPVAYRDGMRATRAAFPSTGSVHFLEDRLENRSSRRGLRNWWTFWHRGQCVDRHDRCDRKDHRKDELEHRVRCHLFPPRCSDPHTLLLQQYRRDRCDAHHIPSL